MRSRYDGAMTSPARKRREKRDRALTSLLFFIGLGLSFVAILWAALSWFLALFFLADWIGNSDRIAGIGKIKKRAIQVAVIVIGTTASSYPIYQRWCVEKASATEGDLAAPHSLLQGTRYSLPIFEIGDSGTWFVFVPGSRDFPYFQFLYDSGLRIESAKNGPELTTPVRDRFGHIIAQITKNHWSVSPDKSVSWDHNYTSNAFEVKDGRGHVVIQIKVLPDKVQIQGEWREFGRGLRMIKSWDKEHPGAMFNFWANSQQEQQAESPIPPMFKYPSREHWAEFAEQDVEP